MQRRTFLSAALAASTVSPLLAALRKGRWNEAADVLEQATTAKQVDAAVLHVVCAWQGQKDLNPRPSVLETDALPTELYPSEAVAGLAAKGAVCKPVRLQRGRPRCRCDGA